MQVMVAGVVPIENGRGDEMHRAETVTLFDDMCLLATLIDPPHSMAAGRRHHGRSPLHLRWPGHCCTLFFNSAGELINFISDDGSCSELEGAFTARRFSTPVRDYRDFGPFD